MRSLVNLFTFVLIIGVLTLGYRSTLVPITLVIDGQEYHLRTQQDTVATLLLDIGLTLRPEDRVTPPPATPLEPHMVVTIACARPVYVHVDGHDALFYTHATSVEGVLNEARVSLLAGDELEVEGDLTQASLRARRLGGVPSLPEYEPVHIRIRRAVPVTLHEDGRVSTFRTTAPTVGEALRRLGVVLYVADGIQPGLGERVTPGLQVYIKRSIPITVHLDGRTIRARTHRERVGDVLADLGVVLTGQDYTTPTLDAPVAENMFIRVVRVNEQFVMDQEPIPFDTAWQPDPELEIDNERLLQPGASGVMERRLRVRYEDGNEVDRTVDSAYVAVPPTTQIFGYGTKIVIRTLETPSGPIEYWRKLRMLATSYSASTAGVPRSSPYFGRTATGMQMRHGIVAVDPRVIPLGSRVYVPGYGIGLAADTGGAIKRNRIDLGYDDDNLVLWYRWVDVYLLTPVPERINYVLD
ncbi:MAG: ubiquitin-like domain-containing protein [Anaerolineae bacterium]|nr:ubiquitin-like domain-containing protein [Anaerolineae bacterium]